MGPRCVVGTRSITLVLGLLSVVGLAQDQTLQVQNASQLVGKKVIVHRLPLCPPGTFTTDTTHAGSTATVISAKPTNRPPIPKSAMDRLST